MLTLSYELGLEKNILYHMKYALLESLDNFSYHFTFLKNKSVWQKKEVGRGENEAICITHQGADKVHLVSVWRQGVKLNDLFI